MVDFKWDFAQSNTTPVNDSDFRWNWAKANVDPSYKAQGPGIGSLLMSMNPNTQQQGLQQINADMARDNAARDVVLKQGAAENQIINELYNQDMEKEKLLDSQRKTKGALEGHKSSWLRNYSDAVAKNNDSMIKLLENQAVDLFGEDALQFINEGKKVAALEKAQFDNYQKFLRTIPSDFKSEEEKNQKKDELGKLLDDGLITSKQHDEAIKEINSMVPATVQTKRAITTARANTTGSNVVVQDDSKLFDAILATADPNASKTSRRDWAMKKFREKYGREYKGGK